MMFNFFNSQTTDLHAKIQNVSIYISMNSVQYKIGIWTYFAFIEKLSS